MSYTIKKTDGSVLTTIIDGNIDQVATPLTLIGKSASAYGEYLNENLVYLLENFSNTSQPNHPVQGQLWYDTVTSRLKVYDGANFKLTSGTIVAASVPSSIAQGDIWIDSTHQQLYFNDGVSTILAGPYNPAVTGFNIIEVLDTYGLGHTIVTLTVATSLFAILSNSKFTPDNSILGYTGTINIGLNFVNVSSITNVASPVNDYDVVNKLSLGNAIKETPLVISIDISTYTGNKNALIITNYLNVLFPASEYAVANVQGPRCRAICTNSGEVTISQFIMIDGIWTWQFNL
jgi:hypothetical protein